MAEPTDGTLTSKQDNVVFYMTWCKAVVRNRGHGKGRELFVTGRSRLVDTAVRYAKHVIELNGDTRFNASPASVHYQLLIAWHAFGHYSAWEPPDVRQHGGPLANAREPPIFAAALACCSQRRAASKQR